MAEIQNTDKADQDKTFAAIDLGSNSFHLTLAKFEHENIQIQGVLKHRIQLAAGLNKYNKLSKESIERSVECLKLYGQRLQGIPPQRVKALATYSLRKAKNSLEFLRVAEKALGYPIEVISGTEEARLIYSGVAHYEASKQKLLVIDIGGGSTEFATGKGFVTELLDSLQMGCVSFSTLFFPDGDIKKSGFKRAVTAARLQILSIEDLYLREGWDEVIGTSGTIESIFYLLKERSWIDDGITVDALKKLKKEFLLAGKVENLNLTGTSQNRREIIASGLAILIGIFKSLKLKSMRISDAALREGILFELLGRSHNEDIRDKAIQGLRDRFHVNVDQARRVGNTAKKIFKMVKKDWGLDKKEYRQLLRWASTVHEVGMALNYSHQQKHGEYIIRATDISGFSIQRKNQLALLVRANRRKFPLGLFDVLDHKNKRIKLIRLARILRLAVLLNHRRRDGIKIPQTIEVENRPYVKIDSEQGKDSMSLFFPKHFLKEMTLVAADLEQEKQFLNKVGFTLDYC